jgi:hypothetical protein
MKGKKGMSYLGKDMQQKPGFAQKRNVKTAEGRVGYTQNETRFGRNNKSTKIPLPKSG